MDIYKFKTAPTYINFQIPFDLTEKDLQQWLNTLKTTNELEKQQQILWAVQSITQNKDLILPKKSLLLENISHSMAVLLKPATKGILNSTLPLTLEELNNARSVIWIYSELANGFSQCVTKKNNQRTLFFGLQNLMTAYLNISSLYQQPYEGFWKQSYLLYGLACKFKIQNQKITLKNSHTSTISDIFKHLLALYHAGLNQFRPRDILTISTYLSDYTSLMYIDTKIVANNVTQYSGFDLNTDTPPTLISHLKKSEKSALRFFSAYKAATTIGKNINENIPSTSILKFINQSFIFQAAKTLSLSQKRKHTRIYEPKTESGILGFKNIITELKKGSELTVPLGPKNIKQYDPRSDKGWAVPDLELEIEGYESIDFMRSKLAYEDLFDKTDKIRQAQQIFSAKNSTSELDQNIWEAAPKTIEPKGSTSSYNLNIADSSLKGYRVIFQTNDDTIGIHIGDIISIGNHSSCEIGIIHRINQLTKRKLELGIKVLGPQAEIAYITQAENENISAWALFLPGIKALKTTDSIIFSDSQFQSRGFIQLHLSNKETITCRLNKLLRISHSMTHISLHYSNIMNK